MPLTLPTPYDLQNHKEGVSDADALQRAADLLFLGAGISTDPTDPLEKRLVRDAIMDMAWYLQTAHEDLEESFSPFQSERIGSYSYTKAQRAVQSGQATGVPAFDTAISYFLALAMGGVPVTDSEWVFKPGYTETPEQAVYHDPSRTGVSSLWPSQNVTVGEDEPEILILPMGATVPPGTPDNTLVVFI